MAFVASEADRSLAKVFIAVLAGCLWTELKISLENHCISGFYHHNPGTIFGKTVCDNFWYNRLGQFLVKPSLTSRCLVTDVGVLWAALRRGVFPKNTESVNSQI